MRREGKRKVHPLAVLVYCSNDHLHSRFAFSAGRRVGKAVVRNKAKRLMRESVRRLLPEVKLGFDVLLIARAPIAGADFREVDNVVEQLLRRASLLAPASEGAP